MLKIGDFSRICRVTIKTLHYYDRLGLLKPTHVDKFTGHRYYAMDQIPTVNRILVFKDLGLSLDEIQHVFDEDVSALEIRGMLRLKQAELQIEIEDAQARLQRIGARIYQIDKEGNMPEYDVIMKTVPAQRVLAVREIIPSADYIEQLFADVGLALKMNNIKASDMWMAIYYHEGFRDTHLDIEIAVPISEKVNEPVQFGTNRRLEIRETIGYERMATVIENGHNESWSGSYNALGQFIEANQYKVAGTAREVYLTNPDDDAGWLIEIQIPVKAKSKNNRD